MDNIITKMKKFLFTPTNATPFMLGVFVGLMVFNTDVLSNSLLTLITGTAYHTVKAIASNLVP